MSFRGIARTKLLAWSNNCIRRSLKTCIRGRSHPSTSPGAAWRGCIRGAEPSVDQSRCGVEGPDLPGRGVYVSYALLADRSAERFCATYVPTGRRAHAAYGARHEITRLGYTSINAWGLCSQCFRSTGAGRYSKSPGDRMGGILPTL